jgi:hypothetical protein
MVNLVLIDSVSNMRPHLLALSPGRNRHHFAEVDMTPHINPIKNPKIIKNK